MNEAEMREAKAPTHKSIEELGKYIEQLVKQDQDYGTCVYAMSLAAVSAFNYVASELGVTGFQASCADLDIIKRTRSINGPFMIIKFEDALFPQYAEKFVGITIDNETAQWLTEEAKKRMEEGPENYHPNVWLHIKGIAAGNPPFGMRVKK